MMKIKRFFKNNIILLLGNISALLIPLLLEPFLKRMYNPEEFGKYSIYLKLFNLFFIFSTLCYEIAIIVEKEEKEIKKILNTLYSINIIFLILGESVVLVLIILKKLSIDSIYFIFLPLTIFFYSIGVSLNNYLVRNKEYIKVAKNKAIRRSSESALQLCFSNSFFKIDKYGLFLGNLLGSIFFYLYNKKMSNLKLQINFSKILEVMKKYRDYPKYNFFPKLLNTISMSIFDFYILLIFSVKEVGYLELTQKILLIPSLLLSESFGKVLLQTTSERVNKNESIVNEIKYNIIFLSIIGISYFLIMYGYSEIFYRVLFGENWEKSGIYAKYLIGYISLSLVVGIFSNVLLALKKFRINSYWQYLQSIILVILVFIKYESIEQYLFYYNLSNILLYLIYLFIIVVEIYKYEKMKIEKETYV